MNLYDIAQQYIDLAEMDLDEQTLKDTLERIDGDFEDKADNMLSLIKSLTYEQKALENESMMLLKRATETANKIESLKKYLLNCMTLADKQKFKSSRNTVSICTNSVESLILSDNFDKTPYTVKIEIEKFETKLIKEKLESGEVVDGAHLEQGKHLRIR